MPRPAPKVAIKIAHNGRGYTARTRLKPHTPQRRPAFSQRLIDECRSLERGGTRRFMLELRRLQKLKCSNSDIMTKWQTYLGKQVARGRLPALMHPSLSPYDQVLRNNRNTDPYSVELRVLADGLIQENANLRSHITALHAHDQACTPTPK